MTFEDYLKGMMSGDTNKMAETMSQFTSDLYDDQLDSYDRDGVGAYGEKLTVEMIKQSVTGYYRLIQNLILPINGTATEIDIVLIHEKGIFVIESKNYSGWIFGDKNQKTWTQTLAGGKKNHFYNPIMQNRTHCNAICDLTKVPRPYVMSYIVFSERCTLKVVPENEMYLTIVQRQNLVNELNKDFSVRSDVFTREVVDSYYKGFQYYIGNEELKKKHEREIHREGETRSSRLCPKCGRRLRLTGYNGPVVMMCPDLNRCGFKRKATQEEIDANKEHLMNEQREKQINNILFGPHQVNFNKFRVESEFDPFRKKS